MHPDQRIGIFIDAQNIYHSAKNLYQSRVNFEQLVKALTDNRPLIRVVVYVVKSEGIVAVQESEHGKSPRSRLTSPEAAFFDALRKSGFELRLKDLQVYPGGMKKADWDVGLAVDAIRMAGSLDVVILVTGDGDFVPLVEYLKWGLGKQVEIAAFHRTSSNKLRESADKFIDLESIPRILLKSRNMPKQRRQS